MNDNKKTKILIVEDESIVAADIEDGLVSTGYEVPAIAASGLDAIDLTSKLKPDLVLMDIRLQGKMTGIEAAKEIYEKYSIPVIYLTAHSDEVTIEHAKVTQPYGYLIKPFGQQELRAAIETALYKATVDRKLTEAARWNRLIVETASNAFVAIDAEGSVIDWNPRAEYTFGWTREEVLGKQLAELIIPEKLKSAYFSGLRNYLKTGDGPLFNKLIEVNAKHRLGYEFPVELTIATSVVDGKQQFLSFIQDISDRKRYEMEQKRREELERANQELERFAHLTSHDLQEPLRTISMYTELLADRMGDQIGEEEKQFMESVLKGARRMRALIEDLLAYSTVGLKSGVKLEELDINASVKNVIENLQATILKKNAKITYAKLPKVMGVSSLVHLLLQNLIGNAIKFCKENTAPEIEISAEREGEFWVFSVKDNGIGFEQQYASSIFNMFKRLYGPEDYAGTGMGLAICKKIIALLGGRIWAESSPGNGAAFYFTLPTVISKEHTPSYPAAQITQPQ